MPLSSREHNDYDDAADEEAEVAIQHGVEEDEDSDSGQQDRRASHAQASTRGGDEAMPDGTPAAGALSGLTCSIPSPSLLTLMY